MVRQNDSGVIDAVSRASGIPASDIFVEVEGDRLVITWQTSMLLTSAERAKVRAEVEREFPGYQVAIV